MYAIRCTDILREIVMARFHHLAAIAAAAALIACSEASTEPNVANLEPGVPPNWLPVGQVPSSYVVGTDSRTVHGGGHSLGIVGIDTSRVRFSGVVQLVRADTYRGKRVRLRAWIRQQNIVGTASGLWMRVDGPGVTQAFDNFSSRPQLGTENWHQVEIILDVPSDALGISFGALMSGRGELFVDDMEFEVIPANGPTTNQLVEPVAGSDSASVAANYARRVDKPLNLDFEQR